VAKKQNGKLGEMHLKLENLGFVLSCVANSLCDLRQVSYLSMLYFPQLTKNDKRAA
jgi:hypothetical protein